MEQGRMEGRDVGAGQGLPRALWLPFAAWAVFLVLALGARSVGAGVFVTALLALVPFGLAGSLLRRTGSAIALSLLLGLAILALLPALLDALGLKPGATAGAAIVGALALPLGSGLGHQRRSLAARVATTPPAPRVAASAAPADPPAMPAARQGAKATAKAVPARPVAKAAPARGAAQRRRA